MAHFQLMAGVAFHRDGSRNPENNQLNVQKFEVGDICEDDRPLDILFANKWRRLDEGPTRKPRDRDDSLDNSGRVMDKPLHARTKKELARTSGHVNVVDPPLAGDRAALIASAKSGKKGKKDTKAKKNAQLHERGFHAKAKDGGRVRGDKDDVFAEDVDEEEDDEQEEEEEVPAKKKKKKKPKEEVEEDEDNLEDDGEQEDDESDEDEDEDDEPPVIKKKMKAKIKKKR